MELDILHANIVSACINEFKKRHGEKHDIHLWSSNAYNLLLNEYLKIDQFQIVTDSSVIWRTYMITCNDPVKVSKIIVDNVEYNTIVPLYNIICKECKESKNKFPKIKKRVDRLKTILANNKLYDKDHEKFNNDIMSIFVGICIEKRQGR